ncbi:hypothetical protein TrLO_g2993 [Triparma laevis f. longispina]|uniref:Uncharacterized protein n=1 Tax=Triparma laevis f. longispina TaxID=1714387 RepID=A0A9W7A3Q9_9STRA|nr:hypothetical protein TrLO_g2993 [Triparma laevis f. longispina]
MSSLLVSSLLHRPLLPLPFKRSLSTAYSFGTSLHGALGIESHASGLDHIVSQPVLTNVHSASAGWGHSIYLRKDGSLFITGKPHEFQSLLRINRLPRIVAKGLSWLNNLGAREDKKLEKSFQSLTPQPIKFPFTPQIITASAGLTAIICTSGQLYTFGINNFGQCGVGKKEEMINLGCEAPITSVSLGLQHGICSNSLGHVYTWGKGERGQLGLFGEGGNVCYGSRVRFVRGGREDDVEIEKVESGVNHCAAMERGRRVVWVWGKFMGPPEVPEVNEDTEDDDDDEVEVEVDRATDAFLSQKFEFEAKVKEMKCGSHQTAVLLNDNSVWAKGILKNGGGLTEYEFVKVVQFENDRSVELHGGHQLVLVVDGKEAYYIELQAPEIEIDEEGNEIATNSSFMPVDFLPEGFDEQIVGVETGWRQGMVLVDDNVVPEKNN